MEDGHFNLAFEESVPQGGGTSDFNELINRPKKDGVEMTGDTNIVIPTKTSDLTNDSGFVNQQALNTLEQALEGEIVAEATARQNSDQTLQNNITTLSDAVSGHDQDIQNLENDVDALQSDVETLEGEVNSIEDVIPAQATASNQLADKAFVNSTVQTGTANFRGNWANWAAVPTDPTEYPADYTGETTPSTNDYMVVQDASGYVDPTEVLAGTWRFKYTGVWSTDGRNGWQPEYQVNETPLTAAQLAALNSGATAALIEQITRNEDAISALDAGKQDLLTAGDNITISTDNEISADVPELLATTGQSTTAGMTQKAITDALAGAGGGGVKVLTTADYNWPTDNPTSVALWLLDDGVYCSNGITVMGNGYAFATRSDQVISVVNSENENSIIVAMFAINFGYVLHTNSAGGNINSTNLNTPIKNSLTSTFAEYALSANQGKVLKDLIDSLIIKGSGAPTTSTVGTVGKLYEDTTNGDLYQCTAVSGSTYTWEAVGGGSSVNVVQATGTSTTDVMSQKATSDMVYLQGAKDKIVIGQNATNNAAWAGDIVIGKSAQAWNGYAGTIAIGESAIAGNSLATYGPIAIGRNATAKAGWAVAIGGQSMATVQGEFSIGGPGLGTDGYNNTSYRKITNVYDGENAHDAVTVNQLNALIDSINSAMNTSIPHIGNS